jgi:SNF2 family DNA or RNA helicase
VQASHPWLLPGAEPSELKKMGADDRIVSASGKMVILDKLLAKMKMEGRKTVIFSQFTMTLDIIDDYLNLRRYGQWPLRTHAYTFKRVPAVA